jgi:hypothetical protein
MIDMSVKDMTDQQLNVALAELTGFPADKLTPNYCNDAAASLEVQVAAIRVNAKKYFNHLERRIHPGLAELPESETWFAFEVAEIVRASPRQRAEAAYMTLSNQD